MDKHRLFNIQYSEIVGETIARYEFRNGTGHIDVIHQQTGGEWEEPTCEIYLAGPCNAPANRSHLLAMKSLIDKARINIDFILEEMRNAKRAGKAFVPVRNLMYYRIEEIND